MWSRPPAPTPPRRGLVLAALSAVAALALGAAGCGSDGPPQGAPWAGDFETGNLGQWQNESGGNGRQSVAGDRIQVVADPVRQGRYAARFEVRQGDRWRDSSGNRAELLQWSGEDEGDRRVYEWSTLFPEDYPSTSVGFQIVTQWHANAPDTQPPILFYASGDEIGLKSVASDAEGRPEPSRTLWRGPMRRGRWHDFRLRVRWSSDPGRGRIELWHDGARVLAPIRAQTLIPGTINYLKQGLYRSEDIAEAGVVYHDGMTVREVGAPGPDDASR